MLIPKHSPSRHNSMRHAICLVSFMFLGVSLSYAQIEPILSSAEIQLEIATIDSLLASESWPDAIERASWLLQMSQDSYYTWQVHERLGLALSHADQAEAAIPHFEQAIRLMPKEPSCHWNLATTLMGLGRRGRAFSEYQEAVFLAPDEWRLRLDYGQALLEFKLLDQALEQFQAAQIACGDCAEVERALARYYLAAGDFQTAIPYLESWYRDDPQVVLRHNLASAYRETKDTDRLRALLLPHWPHELNENERIMILEVDQQAGHTERARAVVQDFRAGVVQTENSVFWALVSLVCLEADLNEDALLAVDRAIALDPTNGIYRNNRVVLLTRLGRHEEAEQEWNRVQEMSGDPAANRR